MEGLSRVGKRYIYRRRVPADLKTIIGRTEIKRSLKTGRYSEAIKLARLIAAEIDRRFIEARLMTKLDPQTLQKIAALHYTEQVAEDEVLREQAGKDSPEGLNSKDDLIEMFQRNIIRNLATPQGAEDAATTYGIFAKDAKREIATGDYRHSERLKRSADQKLKDLGIELDPNSAEYDKVLRLLALAQAEAYQVNADRYKGDYSGQTELVATNKYPAASGELFLNVLDKFLLFKRNDQKEETAKSYRAIAKIFCELMGNRPIDDYTTHDIVLFREKIADIPENWYDKYKLIPISELITMDLPEEVKRFSLRNIKKYLARIVAVFNHAYDQGMITRHIGHNTQPTITRAMIKARKNRPFTCDDLQLLFFKHIIHRKVYAHLGWMPLLALYTGSRRGELAKLRPKDILKVDGIWCLDLQSEYDETDDRDNPKTEHSRRHTPIHPILVECGLLEYAELRRKDKKTNLFDIVAENYGKTFGDTKNKLPDPNKKTFHSFRGTFANELKQAGASTNMYHSIIGHAPSSSLDIEYTEDYTVENKYKEILKLGTFGLDKDQLIDTYKIYLPTPRKRKRK